MDNRQQMYGRSNRGYRQQQQRQQRCGRNAPPSYEDSSCGPSKDEGLDKCVDKTIAKCVNDLPLAMAYVPMQRWENVCDASSGLAQGTIFKDLVKPYCPVLQKRGDR